MSNVHLVVCLAHSSYRSNQLEKIPDIDKYWLDKSLEFLPFLPQDNDRLSEDDELILLINMDLSALLKMKYNQFWSHVVHSQSFQKFLDTFLRFHRRPYDFSSHGYAATTTATSNANHVWGNKERDGAYLTPQQLLFKRVFSVLLRMSSHRETPYDFIDPSYYGNLIYNTPLFDLPRLMEICVLYGTSNRALVQKMVQTIMEVQPKYTADLTNTVTPNILKTIQDVSTRIKTALSSAKPTAPSEEKLQQLQDIVRYMLDVAASLSAFLSLWTRANALFDKQGLIQQLVYWYESAVPEVLAATRSLLDNTTYNLLSQQLQQTRRFIVSVVNSQIQHGYLEIISHSINKKEKDSLTEELLRTLHSIATSEAAQSLATTKDKSKTTASQQQQQQQQQSSHSDSLLKELGDWYNLQSKVQILKLTGANLYLSLFMHCMYYYVLVLMDVLAMFVVLNQRYYLVYFPQ
jgi:hypothetical protein